MTSALLRTVSIIVAYLLASLAAGYAVHLALLTEPTGNLGQDATAGGMTFGLMVTVFVIIFASVPASLVVSLGEFKSWRMWWYYAIAGSLIGLALGTMFAPPTWFPWLGLGFGPVSGLIYWAIAGRNAGLEDQNPRLVIALIFFVIALISLVFGWSAYFGAIF
jgi:hypothetical protein